MPHTRKEFLRNSAVLAAMAMVGSSFTVQKNKPLLAFSTIACPDWDLKQAMDFAASHNYTGLEIRGIKRQMDLTKSPEFATPEAITATMAAMKQKGLKFINLGASAAMHHADGPEHEKGFAEAKSFIDLAQKINCPYVRVFPNTFPKDRDKASTIAIVAKNLLALGEYARTRNVMVLMETHGDFSGVDDVLNTMKQAEHPNIGLVWDISNMWTETKEAPQLVYSKLKKYIRHTHLKDARLLEDGKLQYVFLGQGDVPVMDAIQILKKDNFKGYYSFEWEKLWHAELAEPEIALADFEKVMKERY